MENSDLSGQNKPLLSLPPSRRPNFIAAKSSWPVLFTCFFRIPRPLGDAYIETPIGKTDCFKLSRSIGSGYVTATLYYEKSTTTLIRMDAHSDLDEQKLYSGTLFETNINMHGGES